MIDLKSCLNDVNDQRQFQSGGVFLDDFLFLDFFPTPFQNSNILFNAINFEEYITSNIYFNFPGR